MDLSYSMRLRIHGQDVFFGPGTEELLLLVKETGSLHMAAGKMGMSYSKAWKIIRRAEQELHFPLLERKAGGSGGGFSRLTSEGSHFLEPYQAFCQDVRQAANLSFQTYFGKAVEINETN